MKEKVLKILKPITICLAIAAVLVFTIVPNVLENRRTEEIYARAEGLIDNESYDKALAKLKIIEEKNLKDSTALINLCNAHILYREGNIPAAYFELYDAEFNYQTDKALKKINDFKKTVEIEYDDCLVEAANARAEEYRQKVKNGVPFVGMRECDIANTILGSPSPIVRHNSEMINGKVHEANLYDFKSGSTIIFTARCVQQRVTEVWDKRDNPERTYTPSTSYKKQSKDDDDDPYNAKDYYDAEDFYDDNYDDFYDYEEAEEYYDEHGMW